MLKAYLTEKGVPFTEKLVDQDPTAQEEMLSLSGGFIGTPFTVIKLPDGSQTVIKGFDKERVDEALGLG